jgi:ribonuclease I
MMNKMLLLGGSLLGASYGLEQAMDMYVLAYTWTPEFCYGQAYPGCKAPEDYWKTHFTLHGLWPQYSTGGYPSYCTTEPFDTTVPYTIGWVFCYLI